MGVYWEDAEAKTRTLIPAWDTAAIQKLRRSVMTPAGAEPRDTIEINYQQEEIDMGESQSRYSIIENLAKEKSMAENQIKAVRQTLLQQEKDLSRFLEDNEREIRRRKEDNELFKKQAQLDIEFQGSKVIELEKAISGIKDISKSVEKKE